MTKGGYCVIWVSTERSRHLASANSTSDRGFGETPYAFFISALVLTVIVTIPIKQL